MIYLAGPYFNDAQRHRVDATKKVLDQLGLDYFSPFHDASLNQNPDFNPSWLNKPEVRLSLFKDDIKAIDDCSLMVLFYDGEDPGTMFEAGYLFAYCKQQHSPLIIVKEDSSNPLNIMLSESASVLVSSLKELNQLLKEYKETGKIKRDDLSFSKSHFE